MTPLTAKPLPGTTIDPRYPDEDGRPMGDTDYHATALIALVQALRDFFAKVKDDYVATNLILYYEYGNPRARRDPDVLIAKGVGKHIRRSFRVWEENTLPCTLFEVVSRKTWRTDVGEKRDLYARLGIPEYFLFDPEGKYIKPAFQGFRLKNGAYVPLTPAADGSLRSTELGPRFVPEGGLLRLIDARTGKKVPTLAERAEQERERADKLAAEVKRMRALLSRRKNQD